MQIKATRLASKVALIYLGVAALWILFSDEMVKAVIRNPDERTSVSIFKGWAFVLVTAALLFLVLRRLLTRWVKELEQRTQAESAVRSALDQLRQSEEQFRNMFEAASIGMAQVDLRTRRWVRVNQKMCAITGYSTDEMLQLQVPDLTHPEDRPKDLEAFERVVLGEARDYHLEKRYVRKDGTEVWVSVNMTLIRDDAGQPVQTMATIEDITERKRCEKALCESEERYHQIFAVESDAILVVDRETRKFIDVNPAAERMYGYSREEFLQLRATDVSAEPAKTLGNLDSKIGPALLLRHRRKDGTIFPVEVSDSTIEFQGRMIKVGAMRDITDRKRVEVALQASEEKFRQISETITDVFWICSPDFQVMHYISPAYENIWGRSLESLYAQPKQWIDAIFPEERERVCAVFATLREGEPEVSVDYHIARPNGEVRWIHDRGFQIRDEAGQLVRITGIASDITERKQAEAELRRHKEILEETGRIAKVGGWQFDVATGTGFWADEVARIHDVDPAQPISKDIGLQYFVGASRPKIEAAVSNAVEKGISYDLELEIISAKGIHKWVRTIGHPATENGRVVRVNGSMQDITERRQAEEQLHLQLSTLTAAANAIVITDCHGKIEWVNPSFTRLTGYSAEEAIGSNPRVLKSGQHPPAFYANLWATISTGNVWHGEMINQRKGGRQYTEEMTITPVRNDAGQIAHYVAIKQDVTERRTLENQLRQAQKMEAIGTLAGGIAHDFNNILAAMFGYGYLLQQDMKDSPVALESLAEILKAASRAKDLVLQILTFSRQLEHKRQVIRLDAVVREATKFLRASIPANIKIETTLAADAPAVLADPTQIYQVTMNLATNSLHAMEGQTGQLTVNLDTFEPSEEFRLAHPEFQPVQCPLPTPARAWMPRPWSISMNRFSPPSQLAKAPASDWPWCMASSNRTTALSPSTARSAAAQPSAFIFRPNQRRLPQPTTIPARFSPATVSEYCCWTTNRG